MKEKISIFIIFVFAVCLYGLTLHGVWGSPGPSEFKGNLDQQARPFELSPERGRYAHIYSLAENHTYTLNQDWANVVYPDVGIHDGKFYSFFAPGISYMATPLYMLGKYINLGQVFSFSLVSLFSIAALITLYVIARNILKLSNWAALFSVFAFGFASSAWGYAVTLYQHHITTFLILFALYAVWKFKQQDTYKWFWSVVVGLCYALAVFIDYPNAIIVLPVILYFITALFSIHIDTDKYIVSIRAIGFFALASFLILTSFHFYHNHYYYGSWKTLSGGIPSYHLPSDGVVHETQNAVEVAQNTPVEKNIVGFFTEEHVPNSFYTLILSTDRGLFFFCPIFLLAFLGIFSIRSRFTTDHIALLSVVAVNVFLYSSWGDPWGGWAFGPRYLIPSMAILSLFVGLFVDQYSYRWIRKIVAFLLAVFGSFVGLLGVLTTNAIPPKVEAMLLPIKKYNYFRNLDFLADGKSNSFIFNTHFSKNISLNEYFIYIYSFLLFVLIVILFVLPFFEKKHD